MQLVFDTEQEDLRRSVRRFLENEVPLATVRTLMDTPDAHDPALWRRMAEELGLQGLMVPEEHGGSGAGFVELAVVAEEMGRAVLPGPFFATAVLAVSAILDAGDDEAAKDLLPGIADGSTIATLAVTEAGGRWELDATEATARASGPDWTLHGVKSYVPDGALADLLLVVARTDAGLSLFAVDATASGLTRTAVPTLDQTRPLAHLELDGAAARLVGTDGAAAQTVRRTLHKAAVALALEQVGGAQAALDMAVAYAKQRVQFGRVIGSFQAVKHKAADMMLKVESARAAAYYGAWAVAADSDEVPAVASLAKAYCSDAYFHAAAENIQIHGGIGFTWEHDAHLHLKRAEATRLWLGDPSWHRARLADAIGV
ncbi:acyl-CoA dehydrogenase family protein [Pseudonocardia kunmingensis]|uniref:Alkylation response protein AidB-like acyl-CoA dehydrogenase n=1 Tax=Pseudonocardia kunmingensis TaxID=630975 RepID=A0A543DZR4_9PSEU|nr:acyl-CoA dehydrogenase family protein [Pseudonocardia kunmingensis]TQM14818.1 alkylation response protein AidB-like acyl-CoA dehydrogenase [Pseudonocardia kunmingensis]